MNQIIALVERYISTDLHKSGSEYIMMRCPVHETKDGKPFSVNIKTGKVKCFSCGYRGTLAKLLKEMGVREWKSAEVKESETPKRIKVKRGKVDTLDAQVTLPESILPIFEYCPKNLLDAGFDKDILQEYEVGYDKENSRVTYAIRDFFGKLVGIVGGATFEGQFPKYLWYTRDTLRYFLPESCPMDYEDKIHIKDYLWNSHRLKDMNAEKVVIVEGFKAALWLFQNGYPNTVALQGSILTKIQKEILIRLGLPVVLMLDFDKAGIGTTTKDEKTGYTLRTGTQQIVHNLYKDLLVRKVDYSGYLLGTQPDGIEKENLQDLINNAVLGTQRLTGEKYGL